MSYQAEKFRAARQALMLPLPKGEAHAIADAFFEISLSIRDLDPMRISDPDARAKVQKLLGYMDVSGVTGHSVESSQWLAKAKTFSVEQKQEISSAIDELADWFASNPLT